MYIYIPFYRTGPSDSDDITPVSSEKREVRFVQSVQSEPISNYYNYKL